MSVGAKNWVVFLLVFHTLTSLRAEVFADIEPCLASFSQLVSKGGQLFIDSHLEKPSRSQLGLIFHRVRGPMNKGLEIARDIEVNASAHLAFAEKMKKDAEDALQRIYLIWEAEANRIGMKRGEDHPLWRDFEGARHWRSQTLRMTKEAQAQYERAVELNRQVRRSAEEIRSLTNVLERKEYDSEDWLDAREKLLTHLKRIRRAVTPEEIQLSRVTGEGGVEFDQIRFRGGKWIIVEAKEGNGFEIAKQRGAPIGENPETGSPFDSYETQWAYHNVRKKTVSKIQQLEAATKEPEQFRTLRSSENSSSLLPSVYEVAPIRTIRFEIEGDTAELRKAVKVELVKLRRAYEGKGWEFEVDYGVKFVPFLDAPPTEGP